MLGNTWIIAGALIKKQIMGEVVEENSPMSTSGGMPEVGICGRSNFTPYVCPRPSLWIWISLFSSVTFCCFCCHIGYSKLSAPIQIFNN